MSSKESKETKKRDWSGAKRRARQASGIGILMGLAAVAIYQNTGDLSPIQRAGSIAVFLIPMAYWIFND